MPSKPSLGSPVPPFRAGGGGRVVGAAPGRAGAAALRGTCSLRQRRPRCERTAGPNLLMCTEPPGTANPAGGGRPGPCSSLSRPLGQGRPAGCAPRPRTALARRSPRPTGPAEKSPALLPTAAPLSRGAACSGPGRPGKRRSLSAAALSVRRRRGANPALPAKRSVWIEPQAAAGCGRQQGCCDAGLREEAAGARLLLRLFVISLCDRSVQGCGPAPALGFTAWSLPQVPSGKVQPQPLVRKIWLGVCFFFFFSRFFKFSF